MIKYEFFVLLFCQFKCRFSNIKIMATKSTNPEINGEKTQPGNEGKSPASNQMTSKAPDKDKPNESNEPLEKEDISDLIAMLNVVQRAEGGAGDITDVPENLVKVSRFLITKMMGLRDAFVDPLFKAILDDMVDQREEGQTPSVIVAISRVVPIEQIQEVADNENYAEMQGSVASAEESRKSEQAKNDQLEMNINQFISDIDAYCTEMNYDETEKEALTNYINNFINALADFKLTIEEIKEFDKGRNYGRDINELKSQIPAEPKKEVLPDKASIDESVAPVSQKPKPMTQMEIMAASQPQTDVTQIGARKRFQRQ